MLRLTRGNVLDADADALVNTVNTVGVMGKGIALQFKRAYPGNYKAYKAACEAGALETGRMFVWPTGRIDGPRFILNFPTKKHWRGRSQMEYIEEGLQDLRRVIQTHNIRSVAVPPLGCGNGGLAWDEVRPRIEAALADLDTDIHLYGPSEPEPGASPAIAIGTPRPPLTLARALLLVAMGMYREPGYKLGRLEIQKLGYLLQAAGAPNLRFTFKRHLYGPYSEGLTHAVEQLEGHHIQGFGDRSSRSAIEPVEASVQEARSLLRRDRTAREAIQALQELIQGYETPYGLELLATTHWAMLNPIPGVPPHADLVELVHAWNQRKRTLFPAPHIEQARQRIAESGLA